MGQELLVVEDERGVREGLVRALSTVSKQIHAVGSLGEARTYLSSNVPALILLDLRLKDGEGLSLLRELREQERTNRVPVLVVSAYGNSERTIEAMKLGAFDFVSKPFEIDALLDAVERALRQSSLVSEVSEAPVEDAAPKQDLVGMSPAMLAVWKTIGRAATSTAPVLILGETGTGKERVAHAIHLHSPRAEGPFVAVNLAAIPPTLLESELFGHEKGAFTGALARRAGRIEQAAGGTLFLDEIGDLDLTLQTRLLRVLADGGFQRVGGNETLPNRARIVAATHKPVRPGQPSTVLREDLYYRLAVIEIELPPLRARRSDIPLLVAHALRGTKVRAVSDEALERLNAYDWPGNVRELLHVVQRASVMSASEVIDVPDLPAALLNEGSHKSATRRGDDEPDYDSMQLREALATLEKRLILRALEKAQGNRAEAARILGIARPQLYVRLQEHGIHESRSTENKT